MSAEKERLEYLRGEIRAERISYSEISELQGLVEHIDPSDVELLEWAGVPEFPVEPLAQLQEAYEGFADSNRALFAEYVRGWYGVAEAEAILRRFNREVPPIEAEDYVEVTTGVWVPKSLLAEVIEAPTTE